MQRTWTTCIIRSERAPPVGSNRRRTPIPQTCEANWRVGKTCVLARVRTATKVTVSPFMGDSVAYWLVTGIPDSVGQSWFVPNNGQPASAYMKAWLKGHAGVHGHSPWGHAIARFLRGSVFAWGVCGDMCCSGALE